MAARKNLQWAKDKFYELNSLYLLFDDYYRGRHKVILSDEMRKLFGSLFQRAQDNLMKPPINALRDKMILTGFKCGNRAATDYLADKWKRLRLQTRTNQLVQRAITHGDGYVIVWPEATDPLKPEATEATFYPQARGSMVVRYDDTGETEGIVEAVKQWVVTREDGSKFRRLARYLPDRLERYYMDSATTQIPTDTSKLKEWTGTPDFPEEPVVEYDWSRVPVLRFANSMDDSVYGASEIADAVPLQDMLNKSIKDLGIGEEFMAYPQRFGIGLETRRDPVTGLPINPVQSTHRFWAIEGTPQEVSIGELSAANLTQMLDVIENWRMEVARTTQTPLHYFLLNEGNFPSGEALEQANKMLDDKAAGRMVYFGDCFEDMASLMLEMDGIDPGTIEAVWKPTRTVSQTTLVENVSRKVAEKLIDREQALRELGYDEEQIPQIIARLDAEATKAAEVARTAWERGTNVNPPVPGPQE